MKMGMTTQLLAQQAYTGAQFMKDLGNLVVILVSIAGALMTLYAVYIAYLFWTATDANKRKAARERLIKTVASSLIVIGLAAVLTVINVRFNAAEGRISGPTVGQGGGAASDYTYIAEPTFLFQIINNGSKVEGTFDLDPRFLQKNGVDVDPDGNRVKFTKCQIVSPNWKDLGFFIEDIFNKVGGGPTYTYAVDLRPRKEEGAFASRYLIPAGEKKNSDYYVTAYVSFTIGNEQTVRSFSIELLLESRGGISFYL